MWVQEAWETEEDVYRDLLLLAEFSPQSKGNNTPSSSQIPETILSYKRQMELNRLKTLNSDIDESVSYVVSGRGRGIKDRVIRPGGTVDSQPIDDIELKGLIRGVTGLGYANEFIEKSIRAKYANPESSEHPTKFQLVSMSADSSPIKVPKLDNGHRIFSSEDFPPL